MLSSLGVCQDERGGNPMTVALCERKLLLPGVFIGPGRLRRQWLSKVMPFVKGCHYSRIVKESLLFDMNASSIAIFSSGATLASAVIL